MKTEIHNEAAPVTIICFENLDAIKQFAEENYEIAVVPEKAKRLLVRYANVSQHYEILKEREL